MTSPSFDMLPLLTRLREGEKLSTFTDEELPRLAEEIRHYLVETLSLTGGHLAPNLGVVELCIAVHRVLNTPVDKILFDMQTKMDELNMKYFGEMYSNLEKSFNEINETLVANRDEIKTMAYNTQNGEDGTEVTEEK